MRCLKCGADIGEHKTFCKSCQDGMKEYPVARETPAVILPRPKAELSRPRAPKPEELLADSRKRQKRLVWICAILTLICLGLGGLLFWFWQGEEVGPIGQTYTTYTNDRGTQP